MYFQVRAKTDRLCSMHGLVSEINVTSHIRSAMNMSTPPPDNVDINMAIVAAAEISQLIRSSVRRDFYQTPVVIALWHFRHSNKWEAPVLTVTFFIIGIVLSIAHCVVYTSLDGPVVRNQTSLAIIDTGNHVQSTALKSNIEMQYARRLLSELVGAGSIKSQLYSNAAQIQITTFESPHS